MYDVLVPVYHLAGFNPNVLGGREYNVTWKVVGKASTIEEARKFTPFPVLGS